jgi:hypothetical protein
MEYRRAYGADALFDLPLIDAGAQTYLAAIPTIAAGDVKLFTDAMVSTNPTAFILGFDSMDAEPQPGDVIHEADAGDGQATVMFVVICSGTVGAGTAAGFMFVKSVSGTWTDDAVIDIDSPTVNLDCATVDAGTTGTYTLAANQIANTAGLFAFFGKRAYVALTAAEMSCKQGFVEVVDQTATEEWEDTSLNVVTEGHESALDPQGCILTDPVGSATGQTTTNLRLSGAPATAPKVGYYFEVVSGTSVGNAGYVKTYTAGATYDVVPYVALDIALGADSVVKFFRDAKRVPAHIVATEDIGLSATQKTDVNAEVDTALNTAIPGGPTADSINQRVVAIDDLTQASGSGDLAAILTDTGTTLPATLVTISGYLDTEIAAILALLDDARAEPSQGAPPVNPDVVTKIDYLYKAWRNRHTQSATEYALYADNATTKDHEAVVSDNGTIVDRGEVGTGA